MDDVSRREYPAMVDKLHHSQAVQALSDRVKRISKLNQEIADWLQERRKVEEAYVSGLRKLLLFKVPNPQSELGVFQPPWDKILQSTDAIASSHTIYAQQIEKDVELALRNFQNKAEMQEMHSINTNLHTMAKEHDDAYERSEKLNKKGPRANAQKVDQATSRLERARQQWDTQAPLIFERLQALDEQRTNHLRDVLTQFQTHEVDQAARTQASAEGVLNALLEVKTDQEIHNFVQRTLAQRQKNERRSTGTRSSSTVPTSNLAPPSLSGSNPSVDQPFVQDQMKSIRRLFSSRRASTYAEDRGTRPSSSTPSTPPSASTPRPGSKGQGRTGAPLASLSSLPESPTLAQQLDSSDTTEKPSHEGTNGVTSTEGTDDTAPSGPAQPSFNILNGTAEDIFDAPPPPGPPPSHQHSNNQEPTKDADGYTVPAPTDDPISQAQREAAAEAGEGEGADQFFKVNIQKEPVAEEDPDEKKAALSKVANTLTQMGMPLRKAGTIKGRRTDFRNTMYGSPIPEWTFENPLPESTPENPVPPSPASPGAMSRPPFVPALASEASITGTSDTQSVRSGVSLGSLPQRKHPDMHGVGLSTSVIEYVSASFENGVVRSARINGEIAFSYKPDNSLSNPDHETIRINYPPLSIIGLHQIIHSIEVVNKVSFSPDECYAINLPLLSTKPYPSFTYDVHPNASLASQCPLMIKPEWKPTGDKLGLVLHYGLNPSIRLPQPVTLSNVFIIATYEGAHASGAQSKPASTHLKDKHVVYWRLGDITLSDSGKLSKVVCLIVGEGGAEPRPGHIEARWEYVTGPAPLSLGEVEGEAEVVIGSGISISRLVEGKGKGKAADVEEDDPFADNKDQSWVDVPTVRKLASGKYEGR